MVTLFPLVAKTLKGGASRCPFSFPSPLRPLSLLHPPLTPFLLCSLPPGSDGLPVLHHALPSLTVIIYVGTLRGCRVSGGDLPQADSCVSFWHAPNQPLSVSFQAQDVPGSANVFLCPSSGIGCFSSELWSLGGGRHAQGCRCSHLGIDQWMPVCAHVRARVCLRTHGCPHIQHACFLFISVLPNRNMSA